MGSFIVFLQKEWIEMIRTKRLLILLCIFVFFGILGPVVTRYTPDILNLAMGAEMEITLPPVTWADSWGQLYGNLAQVGGICIILLFMGCITGEKQSGSTALTLTKNLSHTGFVMAKFIAMTAAIIVSMIVTVAVCYGYTYLLFGFAGNIVNVILGAVIFIVFMLTVLGFTILASALSKNTTNSAIIALFSFIILSVSAYLPWIGSMMPGMLLAKTTIITVGEKPGEIIFALLISLCILSICIFGAISILKKQEL